MYYPGDLNFPFNVTVGFRDLTFLKETKLKPGRVKNLWLDLMVSLFRSNIIIKYCPDKIIGAYDKSENIYAHGLLGMLQREEIDFAWAVVPITLTNMPGEILGPLIELDFIICSHNPPIREIYSLISTFEIFDTLTWLLLLGLILLVETLSVMLIVTGKLNLWSSLFSALRSLPGTIFTQYTPVNVPRVKVILTVGLLLLASILNASFNTQAIKINREDLVDNLLDIIKFKRIPFITDNCYDWFIKGQFSVFKEIFSYATELGANNSYPIDSVLVHASNNGAVISSQHRCQLYQTTLRLNNNPLASSIHFSRPFAKSISVFLIRKGFNSSDKHHKRFLDSGKFFLEFGLSVPIRSNLYYKLRSNFTEWQIIKASRPTETKPWQFNQLNLSAYQQQLKVYSVCLISCFLPLIIEIIYFRWTCRDPC
ncbi:uncharacterized protein LOC128395104 [Panonychus citri]|uniref:uncharacterized protein LOC128395104 n=1 Tax=Panonychus citri TaxID=50023 RepID=UPI0023079861|nr:uncharacterized protein LOC128395104 [Panonychus citri]